MRPLSSLPSPASRHRHTVSCSLPSFFSCIPWACPVVRFALPSAQQRGRPRRYPAVTRAAREKHAMSSSLSVIETRLANIEAAQLATLELLILHIRASEKGQECAPPAYANATREIGKALSALPRIRD